MNNSTYRFFPGGNTTNGFFSYYSEITNKNTLKKIYTIKGGPGVGKSTLMKEIGSLFEKNNSVVYYYHCSSDPRSLDGVYIKDREYLFVDGTSPHIIDPVYPGVLYELINLADYLDYDKLKPYKNEIIDLSDRISDTFKTSYSYLRAVKEIYNNLNFQYEKVLDKVKFFDLTKNLYNKITNSRTGKGYNEQKLFLSAVTPNGLVNFLNESIKTKYIYIINSEIGDLSYKILKNLRTRLILDQFSIKTFYCPMFPDLKVEHIIIPELDTSIVTSNKYHNYSNGININTEYLYNLSSVDTQILESDRGLIDTLINYSVNNIRKAKLLHDLLEEYYKKAMNYDKLNSFNREFLKSIST